MDMIVISTVGGIIGVLILIGIVVYVWVRCPSSPTLSKSAIVCDPDVETVHEDDCILPNKPLFTWCDTLKEILVTAENNTSSRIREKDTTF